MKKHGAGSYQQGPGSGEHSEMEEKQFRFEDFEIWKKGAAISEPLFDLADDLDNKRFYRFAEQLRAATLSITG